VKDESDKERQTAIDSDDEQANKKKRARNSTFMSRPPLYRRPEVRHIYLCYKYPLQTLQVNQMLDKIDYYVYQESRFTKRVRGKPKHVDSLPFPYAKRGKDGDRVLIPACMIDNDWLQGVDAKYRSQKYIDYTNYDTLAIHQFDNMIASGKDKHTERVSAAPSEHEDGNMNDVDFMSQGQFVFGVNPENEDVDMGSGGFVFEEINTSQFTNAGGYTHEETGASKSEVRNFIMNDFCTQVTETHY
jgi:hypothetical protein